MRFVKGLGRFGERLAAFEGMRRVLRFIRRCQDKAGIASARAVRAVGTDKDLLEGLERLRR